MVMKKPFTTASPALATFSFTEQLTGLSFVTFYLTRTSDDSGDSEILTSYQPYSSIIDYKKNAPGTQTFNFDTSTFDFAVTASGTAICNIGYKNVSGAGSAESIAVTLLKYDGSSETAMSSTFTESPSSSSEGIMAFELPLTETNIKAGEQIRLKVALTADGTANSMSIGHDPQNRDGLELTPSSAGSITSSRIYIPFLTE